MGRASTAAAAAPLSPAPVATARFEFVPLERLVESESNHRKHTWGAMDELVASVRAKGVLQPILVRPIAASKGETGFFEVVFGHRRFRAAKEAGLVALPAVVRELSDVEALEANVIENLQRQDVHPLEEAEGYEQLLAQKERPYTVEDLAAKVGKSKAYVYGRMKLLALCPEARKAFYDGTLSPSVALLVARIPRPEQQVEALKELEPDPWSKAPRSLREAQDIVQSHFMLRLAEAPFATDDATLVPTAGPCTSCPNRTGNAPELFADVKSPDTCTDRKCFAQKKAAWAARQLANAEADGRKVIAGDDAKKVLEKYGNGFTRTSGLIELSEPCYDDDKQRTYKQLLGKKAPVVLVQKPNGELVEAVERKAAVDVLKEKGVKLASERLRVGVGDSVERDRKKHALKRLTVELAITAIVNRAEARELDDDVVRYLAEAQLSNSWHDVAVDVVKRRGIDRGKKRPEEAIAAALKDLTTAQLRGFIVELLISKGAYFAYQSGHTDSLRWAAKLYRVDLAKCATEAKAELRAKAAAKKPTKAKRSAR